MGFLEYLQLMNRTPNMNEEEADRFEYGGSIRRQNESDFINDDPTSMLTQSASHYQPAPLGQSYLPPEQANVSKVEPEPTPIKPRHPGYYGQFMNRGDYASEMEANAAQAQGIAAESARIQSEAIKQAALARQAKQAEFDQFSEEKRAEKAAIDRKLEKDIDPQGGWNTMETGGKIMHTLAVAIGGFTEGYTKGRIKNTAMQMLDKTMSNHIEFQREKMKRLRYKKTDIDKEINFMQQNMLNQASQAAQHIEQMAQSSLIKTNAQQAQLGIKEKMDTLQHNMWKEQKSERIAASERKAAAEERRLKLKAMLTPSLADQIKVEQHQKPGRVIDKIVEKKSKSDAFKKSVYEFEKQYKALSLRPGVSAWYGGDAEKVEQLKLRVVEEMVKNMLGNVPTEMLKKFEDHLGSGWSSDKEVKGRIKNLLRESDQKMESYLGNYAKHYPQAVAPYWADLQKTKAYHMEKYGVKYPKMIKR